MTEQKITTSGTTVKIDTPKGVKRPKVSVIVGPDDVARGFVDFLREHAIVGLAVGLVIGTQVKSVVDQIVNSFINPLFTLIFGGQKLNERKFTAHFAGHTANFGWGAVAYALVDFIFVLMAIYAIIKIFNLEKLDKKKTPKAE
jgi:large conductance mechanosensitive channel protein